MSKGWVFRLADRVSLQALGEFTQARNRSLTLALNKAGSCELTVSMSDPLASSILPAQMAIIAMRDGVPRWSGPIWTAEDDFDTMAITVNAVGWFETLNGRIIRPSALTSDLIWTNVDAGAIAFDMLNRVNAIQTSYITAGVAIPSALRNWRYEILSFKKVGSEITQLSEVENGFDFTIDPITRVMNIYDKRMTDRTQGPGAVYFARGWGPHNLSSVKRTRDASTLLNWMWAQGKSGPAALIGQSEPDAINSQNAYGVFEDKADLGEVADINVLLAYAGGEVLLRENPRQLWSIVPKQAGSLDDRGNPLSIPRLFDDYNIGDLVNLMVRGGIVNMTAPLAVRIFGASISIDEEGNEKITSLQTSP